MSVDEATPDDIHELAEPLAQRRLVFAGEHTSSSHPAQVTGALLSGLRAAGQVRVALSPRALEAEVLEEAGKGGAADADLV